MKRADVLAALVFWVVVAGLIAIRVAVGPTEAHGAPAAGADLEFALARRP